MVPAVWFRMLLMLFAAPILMCHVLVALLSYCNLPFPVEADDDGAATGQRSAAGNDQRGASTGEIWFVPL